MERFAERFFALAFVVAATLAAIAAIAGICLVLAVQCSANGAEAISPTPQPEFDDWRSAWLKFSRRPYEIPGYEECPLDIAPPVGEIPPERGGCYDGG